MILRNVVKSLDHVSYLLCPLITAAEYFQRSQRGPPCHPRPAAQKLAIELRIHVFNPLHHRYEVRKIKMHLLFLRTPSQARHSRAAAAAAAERVAGPVVHRKSSQLSPSFTYVSGYN